MIAQLKQELYEKQIIYTKYGWSFVSFPLHQSVTEKSHSINKKRIVCFLFLYIYYSSDHIFVNFLQLFQFIIKKKELTSLLKCYAYSIMYIYVQYTHIYFNIYIYMFIYHSYMHYIYAYAHYTHIQIVYSIYMYIYQCIFT